MALGTFAWGPASIAANVDTFTPPLTIDPACNTVRVSADLAALAAGISWALKIQYRKTATDAWIDYGAATGTAIGGPERNRQGVIQETPVSSGPFPDPGVTGRQVRGVCRLGIAATISGHVTTSA